MTTTSEWIEHDGKVAPDLAPGTRVVVRLGDGFEDDKGRAMKEFEVENPITEEQMRQDMIGDGVSEAEIDFLISEGEAIQEQYAEWIGFSEMWKGRY